MIILDLYTLLPLIGLFISIALILFKRINLLIKNIGIALVSTITNYLSIILFSLSYMNIFSNRVGISFLIAHLSGSLLSIFFGIIGFFILISNQLLRDIDKFYYFILFSLIQLIISILVTMLNINKVVLSQVSQESIRLQIFILGLIGSLTIVLIKNLSIQLKIICYLMVILSAIFAIYSSLLIYNLSIAF